MISFLNMPVSSVVPFLSLLTYALCLLTFFSLFLAAIFLELVVLVCSGCKFFSFCFFLISHIRSFCFSLASCASLRFFAGILSFSFLSSFVLIFLFLCMPDISLGLALAFLFASLFSECFYFLYFPCLLTTNTIVVAYVPSTLIYLDHILILSCNIYLIIRLSTYFLLFDCIRVVNLTN